MENFDIFYDHLWPFALFYDNIVYFEVTYTCNYSNLYPFWYIASEKSGSPGPMS
jgi:hypothetical protein